MDDWSLSNIKQVDSYISNKWLQYMHMEELSTLQFHPEARYLGPYTAPCYSIIILTMCMHTDIHVDNCI